MFDFEEALRLIGKQTVLCVGDVMLDDFVYGDVARISPEAPTPVLAVFSLAGGVGKTSLVATLGRALSSLGEKVLLADTTSHGLLPYYFGANNVHTTIKTSCPKP